MGHIHAGGGAMGSMGGPVPPGARGALATGWLAAFGTSGYEDEPPLLEELGINFAHIKMKVGGIEILIPIYFYRKRLLRESQELDLFRKGGKKKN